MTQHPEGVTAVAGDPMAMLRPFTSARIGLGRAGTSLPSAPHLAFQAAHAMARDAVHARLDIARLAADLERGGLATVQARSAAADRGTYLHRPDLGRRLDPEAREVLEALASNTEPPDVAIVVADGLSATAVQRHAAPLLELVVAGLTRVRLRTGPAVLVAQGRVAVGDEIGECLGARLVLLLVGERPGLSSPDSLGVYLTYAPRVGRTDAERNCISNIRQGGLDYATAAFKLDYLITQSLSRGLSGVGLKDETEGAVLMDRQTEDRRIVG
ncbi:MAG: ethanolamine ammonia-lyase subunit EutC [Bauldia sp.]|nr:ethanolamine ammonia-lyase subunit EutC [Bauldia sp.]